MGEGYNGRRVQREKRIREQGEKGRSEDEEKGSEQVRSNLNHTLRCIDIRAGAA